MGCVMDDQPFTLETEMSSIVLIVEADRLTPTPRRLDAASKYHSARPGRAARYCNSGGAGPCVKAKAVTAYRDRAIGTLSDRMYSRHSTLKRVQEKKLGISG